MNVYVDISLCSESSAVGRVHGFIELPAAPQLGAEISFLFPKNNVAYPRTIGFTGLVKISSVQFAANCEEDGILAVLEDVVAPTREECILLSSYFQDGFGLLFEEYDND